jgi:hypothetical protein
MRTTERNRRFTQIYADKTEIRIAAEQRREKDEKGIAAKSTKNGLDEPTALRGR